MDFGTIGAFCAGILAGQLLLLATVRYLFLRGPWEARNNRRKQFRDRLQGKIPAPIINNAGRINTNSSSGSSSSGTTTTTTTATASQPRAAPATDSTLLEYFKYDPSRYQMDAGETSEWLNVLLGQWINVYRYSAGFHSLLTRYLDRQLNSQLHESQIKNHTAGKARLLDFVRVLSIDLGSGFPKIIGCKVGYSETGTLRTELEFQWIDQINMAIETQLNINWPVPLIAALPIQLGVSVVRLTGTLALEFGQRDSDGSSGESGMQADSNGRGGGEVVLLATFMHDLDIRFEIRSLIGHKTSLKDLPKVGELIETILRNFVEEEMVWPNFRSIRLPYNQAL